MIRYRNAVYRLADQKQDAFYRGQAADFVSSVVKKLKAADTSILTYIGGNVAQELILVSVDPCVVDKAFCTLSSLVFQVEPMLGGERAKYQVGSARVIYTADMNQYYSKSDDYTDVLSWLGAYVGVHKQVLVHELIHHLDAIRLSQRVFKLINWEKGPNKYFNDPIETNAYYQAGANDFITAYNNVLRRHGSDPDLSPMLLKLFGGSPEEFVHKHLYDFWNAGFIQHASEKTMNHLKKRIYALWRSLFQNSEAEVPK